MVYVSIKCIYICFYKIYYGYVSCNTSYVVPSLLYLKFKCTFCSTDWYRAERVFFMSFTIHIYINLDRIIKVIKQIMHRIISVCSEVRFLDEVLLLCYMSRKNSVDHSRCFSKIAAGEVKCDLSLNFPGQINLGNS